MFGEKDPGKMYNVYWCRSYTQFFCPSFNTTPLILFLKVILIGNCKSVKGDYFRWANACVQVSRC